MKKLLLPKKCWLPLALVAVLAVGCGLKIATVEFSTHEPMQETELTVKTSFVQEGDNNADNFTSFTQSAYRKIGTGPN